jgi:hypothetical protein
MGSSGTAEPFGLLHHHRRQLSGTRAVHVVLAQGISELIIDQITPVVSQGQIRRNRRRAANAWRSAPRDYRSDMTLLHVSGTARTAGQWSSASRSRHAGWPTAQLGSGRTASDGCRASCADRRAPPGSEPRPCPDRWTTHPQPARHNGLRRHTRTSIGQITWPPGTSLAHSPAPSPHPGSSLCASLATSPA